MKIHCQLMLGIDSWVDKNQLKKVGGGERSNFSCSADREKRRRADKRVLDVLQCDVDGCGISPLFCVLM